MVKLTEVEDEHFTTEKPIPSKDALLVSDNEEEDDDDYTDTGMFATLPEPLCSRRTLKAMGGKRVPTKNANI